MKKFTFCYIVEGVMTMLPLRVTVEAETLEEAKVLARQKVEDTDKFVNMGNAYHIYFL